MSLVLLIGSVALRKESVDRNRALKCCLHLGVWSLSARRAWIEILAIGLSTKSTSVALRKESVDRNSKLMYQGAAKVRVALRKESVDRNDQGQKS